MIYHGCGNGWDLKGNDYIVRGCMEIKVEKPTQHYLQSRKVRSWGIWEKEVSRFDWHYDETEECYLLEWKVVVETKDGNVEFGAGKFVTFPAGLSCVWDIYKKQSGSIIIFRDSSEAFNIVR